MRDWKSMLVGIVLAGAAGLLVLLTAPAATAGQQCPAGMEYGARPYLGPNGQMQQNFGCYPARSTSRSGPFHGVLVFDEQLGWFNNRNGSRPDRTRAIALRNCRDEGGRQCEVVLEFRDACAAVAGAIGPDGPNRAQESIAVGPNRAGAHANAERSCREKWGVRRCEIVHSSCSLGGDRE